jgi:hypothetical protein
MRKLGTEIASIASHYGGKDKKGRTSSDDEDGDSSKRGKGGSSESRRDSYRDDFDQSNDNYSSPTKRAPQYEASSSRTTEADIDYPTAAPRLAPKKPKPSSKPKEKENEA